jgi:hypothetical protein
MSARVLGASYGTTYLNEILHPVNSTIGDLLQQHDHDCNENAIFASPLSREEVRN